MFVAKSKINETIQNQIRNFQTWAGKNTDKILSAKENNMTGCVFVQQISARKYQVGWRFTPQNTKVGEIQLDPHNSYNRNIEIVWVS